jgi:hypothetical protein
MPEFYYQFRREQRSEFTITADTQEEADEQADDHIQTLDLTSKCDCSDDPGELELLEVHEDGKLIEDYFEQEKNGE